MSKESKKVDQDPNPPKKNKNVKDILDGSRVEEEKEWLSDRERNQKDEKKEIKNSKKEVEDNENEKDKMESTLNKEEFKKKEKPKLEINNKKLPQRSNSMINPPIVIKCDEDNNDEPRAEGVEETENSSPKTEKKFNILKEEFDEEKEGTFISDTLTLNKKEFNQMNEKSKQLEEENSSLKQENEKLKRKLTELMGMSESDVQINKEMLDDVFNNKNAIKFNSKKDKKPLYKKVKNNNEIDEKKKREKFIEKIIKEDSKEDNFEIRLSTEEEPEEEIKENEVIENPKSNSKIEKSKESLKAEKKKVDFDREDTIEKIKLKKSSRNRSKSKEKKQEKDVDYIRQEDIEVEDDDEEHLEENKFDIKNTKLNSRSDKYEFLIEKFGDEEKLKEYLNARKESILTENQLERYEKTKESKKIF